MTADSSSPRDGLNSPQFRRKNLPSPWAQVVRGDSESISAVHHSPSSPSSITSPPVASLPEQTTFSGCFPPKSASSSSSPPPDISLAADGGSDSNSNINAASRSKKPAWNKPSNGVVEVGPVMGAASWPALSESARVSPKSLADSPSKTVPDGLLSTSQGPVIPQSTQKQGTSNANSNSTPNRAMSGKQRSSKRGGNGGGGGNSSASGHPQSGFSHQHPTPPPPPPPFPVIQMPPNSYGNFVPAMPDPSIRDHQYRGNNWDTRPAGGFASQSHNDHRRSSRRGGYYGPRGDGYNNNFGGRRDQDRRNYGSARDGHTQHQGGPSRSFPRPSPPSAHTFVPPQPVRPYMSPIGYSELIYFTTMPMEPFRGMPMFTPAPHPAMIMNVLESPVHALLLRQIEYYFSDDNLVKDEFLKSNMDHQGWVAISLIAGFPRVKSLTSNIQLILDSLRSSIVVEVQDDRVRRRNEWMKWIPSRVNTESGLLSPAGSNSDMLANTLQQITVKEESTNRSEAGNVKPYAANDTSEKPPSELIGCTQLPKGEGSEETCLDQN